MIDDAELLGAAAAGDATAFETFMRAHQPTVTRYLTTYAGTSDVDDAVQETFIAAWRGAGGFHGGSSARAWLFTIARHTVHHQVRRRIDEPTEFMSLEQLAGQAGWGSLAEVSVADAPWEHELLHTALQRLPADEREVLALRELDGFSGDETAKILSLSLPAMKSRLHRARIHLAAQLRLISAPLTSQETRHG